MNKLTYVEINAFSCYSVEVTHTSDMAIGIVKGEVRGSPFSNNPCDILMFSFYWRRWQVMRRYNKEFGYMEYGTICDGSVVAFIFLLYDVVIYFPINSRCFMHIKRGQILYFLVLMKVCWINNLTVFDNRDIIPISWTVVCMWSKHWSVELYMVNSII